MNVEIAQRLADMRRKKGYSQEALAAELGLSRQAISKWERAESQPDTGNLIMLADLYGVTIDELIRVDASIEDDVRFETASKEGDQPTAEPVDSQSDATDHSAADAVPQPPSDDGAREQPIGSGPSYPPPTGAPVRPAPDPYPSAPPRQRNPLLAFPYPVLVVIIYLAIGFLFGWWHPGWVLFLTIPFYYWIAGIVGNDPEFRDVHSTGHER